MPEPLTPRELAYIEDRLLAPCSDAWEALERLRKLGRNEEADRLFKSIKDFTDATRALRRDLLGGG